MVSCDHESDSRFSHIQVFNVSRRNDILSRQSDGWTRRTSQRPSIHQSPAIIFSSSSFACLAPFFCFRKEKITFRFIGDPLCLCTELKGGCFSVQSSFITLSSDTRFFRRRFGGTWTRCHPPELLLLQGYSLLVVVARRRQEKQTIIKSRRRAQFPHHHHLLRSPQRRSFPPPRFFLPLTLPSTRLGPPFVDNTPEVPARF